MPPLPRLLHHHLSLSLLHRQPPRRPWPPAAHAFLRRGLASSSSPAAAAVAGREKSSRRTLAYLLGVAAAMVGASYAAVPLYRRFCQATGYGGTVQRRESVEEKISRHARDGTMTSREIIVQFNADVADGMPWKFIPTQREVRVKPGESALAFYTAENRSSTPITGVSTYNVAPMKGKAKKVVPAQTLWFDILKAQIETGTPYMLYKDTCNRKSNQQNLGTIKSSNLCTEIIEFTSPTETVVCNLASIALPRFVKEKGVPIESHPSKLVGSSGWKNRYFDFDKLAEVTSTVTYNLNKIIDINYYPVETAKRSNIRHRPIGIGVQGLADTFILLGMPFDSPEAQQLNKDIFETIYYHALKASAELAAKEGPYETYEGCPVSKGILQPDMWNVVPSDRWNWPAREYF